VFSKKQVQTDAFNCVSQTQKNDCTLSHFKLNINQTKSNADQMEGQFTVMKNVAPKKQSIKKASRMSETLLKSPRTPRYTKTDSSFKRQNSCPELKGPAINSPTTQQSMNDQFQAYLADQALLTSTSGRNEVKGRTKISIKDLLC
jgi:hypothetical protein